MASKIRLVTFTTEEGNFVAYGTVKDYLPVYKVGDGYHTKTLATFPAIMKFVEPDRLSEAMVVDSDYIRRKYGEARLSLGNPSIGTSPARPR